MNIRIAKKEDLKTVIELTHALAIYEKEGEIFSADEDFFLNNILCENPKAECYLIENDAGEVVGMGEIFVSLSTYTSSYKLNLQDFYICEPSRGKGYGRAFMQFLALEAQKRGCTRICWGVYKWNKVARALYDKVGTEHDDTAVYSMDVSQIKAILSN